MEEKQKLTLSGSFEKWFKLIGDRTQKLEIYLAQKALSLDAYCSEYYIDWIWHNQKSIALFPILKKNRGKFCDIGCGMGTLHSKFFDSGKEIEIVGIDIAPTGLAIAKKINKDLNCKYIKGDAYDIPLPSSEFDDVFSLQLYQNLDEPVKLLKEMKRIVKPEGTITVTTTNFFQDLLWQPSALLSFIINKRYPNNSKKKIIELAESLGLSATVEYCTFRPKQSVLQYIPKSLFHFVLTQCQNIESFLYRIKLENLCTVIVIRFGTNNGGNKYTTNEKRLWADAPITLFVFISLILFHWYIDLNRWISKRFTK